MSYFGLRRGRTCEDVFRIFAHGEGGYCPSIALGTTLILSADTAIGSKLVEEVSRVDGFLIVCGQKLSSAQQIVDSLQFDREKVFAMEANPASFISLRVMCDEVIRKLQRREIPPIRLLILNATYTPYWVRRRITWEGFERSFQTNFFANFLVYQRLKKYIWEGEDFKPYDLESADSSTTFMPVGCKVVLLTRVDSLKPCSIDFTNFETLMRTLVRPQFLQKYSSSQTLQASKLCNVLFAQGMEASDGPRGIYPAVVALDRVTVSDRIFSWKFMIKAESKLKQKFPLNMWYRNVDQAAASVLTAAFSEPSELRGNIFHNHVAAEQDSFNVPQTAGPLMTLSRILFGQVIRHQALFYPNLQKVDTDDNI